MTLTIELPPQKERILRAKAARLGVPIERYALDTLLRDAEEPGLAISEELARKRAQISSLLRSSLQTRKNALKAGAETAAAYYATPEGQAELADWRALNGEDFNDPQDESRPHAA